MSSKNFILIIALLAVPFYSTAQIDHCIADRYSQTPLFDSSAISIDSDVLYAVAERWPSSIIDSLRMDVYQPDQAIDQLDLRPLIVMVHGGAWLAGNREELAYHSMEMARRGFVTATITYRLGWDCPATDVLSICLICSDQSNKVKNALYRAVQDERAALRHLVANAAQYGIDTEKIFVQGESAGSFTVLNSTFWDQEEANTFCPWCFDDMGGLDDSGNDLTESYDIKGVVNNCGGLVSTLDNLDGHDIPIIGFHDEWDCVAPYGAAPVLNCLGCTSFFWSFGSNSIAARLNQNGVCQRMNRKLLSLGHCTYPANALIQKSACFLKSILCDDCTSDTTTDIWNIPDCTAGSVLNGVEAWNSLSFKIYPDPVSDLLHIAFDSSQETYIEIAIIGLDGRVEKRAFMKGGKTSIDVSNLCVGMKLIRLTSSEGDVYTKRFIKAGEAR